LRGRRAFPFGLRRDGPCDRAGLEGVRPEPEVQAALLEPDVLSPHQAGRELVLAGVLVAPEIPKEPPDPAAGRAADEVGQRRGAPGPVLAAGSQPARMSHRGGLRASSLLQRSRKSRRTLRRDWRQKRSASAAAPPASAWPSSRSRRAWHTEAAIVKSSITMSTQRKRNPCFRSILAWYTTIPWKLSRASFRELRSTKRRWRARPSKSR